MEIIGHLWIQVDAIYVSNDYHSSLMLRPNCENNIVNVSWRHPPSDSFKLNCDASVQPQCKKAFIEGVFRNHFGNVIFAYSFDIGSCSVLIAETWAILIGIQTAQSHGFKRFIEESDSLLAIQQLPSECPDHHPCYSIWQSILEFSSRGRSFQWTHTLHEGNQVTNSLTNYGLSLINQHIEFFMLSLLNFFIAL